MLTLDRIQSTRPVVRAADPRTLIRVTKVRLGPGDPVGLGAAATRDGALELVMQDLVSDLAWETGVAGFPGELAMLSARGYTLEVEAEPGKLRMASRAKKIRVPREVVAPMEDADADDAGLF